MLSRKHFFAVSISRSENFDSCKGIVHKMKFLESLSLSLSQSKLFKYNKHVKNNYFHLLSEEHGTKDIIYQTLGYGTWYL